MVKSKIQAFYLKDTSYYYSFFIHVG